MPTLDNFPGISLEKFNQLTRQRDVSELRGSVEHWLDATSTLNRDWTMLQSHKEPFDRPLDSDEILFAVLALRDEVLGCKCQGTAGQVTTDTVDGRFRVRYIPWLSGQRGDELNLRFEIVVHSGTELEFVGTDALFFSGHITVVQLKVIADLFRHFIDHPLLVP